MVRMRKMQSYSIITESNNTPKYKKKELSLSDVIKNKVKILQNDFKIEWITDAFFNGCTNEIQVEQRAKTAIFSR